MNASGPPSPPSGALPPRLRAATDAGREVLHDHDHGHAVRDLSRAGTPDREADALAPPTTATGLDKQECLYLTVALVENLADPVTAGQLDLLEFPQRRRVRAFVASGTLPGNLTDEFVGALRDVLSGLDRVVLTGDGIRGALSAGRLPATPDEIRRRFDRHLAEEMKDLDPARVRIVLEDRRA